MTDSQIGRTLPEPTFRVTETWLQLALLHIMFKPGWTKGGGHGRGGASLRAIAEEVKGEGTRRATGVEKTGGGIKIGKGVGGGGDQMRGSAGSVCCSRKMGIARI